MFQTIPNRGFLHILCIAYINSDSEIIVRVIYMSHIYIIYIYLYLYIYVYMLYYLLIYIFFTYAYYVY